MTVRDGDINERIRRRYLLEYLSDSSQHRANGPMAAEALTARGLPSALAGVALSVRWLEAQGFLIVDAFGDFLVFDLTAAGLEIAEGKIRHEGVAPYRPRR